MPLGREMLGIDAVGPVKADQRRVVGIFYITWHMHNLPDPEGYGIYFQERLDDALAANPHFLYLNDWNEWTADKYNGDVMWLGRKNPFMFVDQYNSEFNRTIQPMLRYIDRYIKSMIICYNIVRQYDPNASVLASYTHNWTKSNGVYAPKDMPEKTVEYSNVEGNFRWGVAYHPYPQYLTKPAFWINGTQATYSMDSSA